MTNKQKSAKYKAYYRYYKTYGTFHESTPENVKNFIKQNINRQEAKTDVEYGKYVKKYYQQQKQLKKGGVDVYRSHKQGLWQAGAVFEDWKRGDLLSKEDYYKYKKTHSTMAAETIAVNQFNLLSVELANTLKEKLVEAGLNKDPVTGQPFTIEKIRARRLPQEVWDQMQLYVDQNGLDDVGWFFGS